MKPMTGKLKSITFKQLKIGELFSTGRSKGIGFNRDKDQENIYKKTNKSSASLVDSTYKTRLGGTFRFEPNTLVFINNVSEDLIPGGKGDKTSIESVNKKELYVGVSVEMEHTDDKQKAKEIAIDHLTEDPKYYSKLIKAGLVDEPEALKKAKEVGICESVKLAESKMLKEMIRDIIKEESIKNLNESVRYFNKEEIKKIYELLSELMGVKFPRKVFKDGKEIEIKLKDGTDVSISSSIGIVIIQNFDKDIKNYNKIVNGLKKIFGDVSHDKRYINARDFGGEYEEYANVKNPTNIKPIIKIDINKIKTVGDAKNVLSKLDNIIKSREAKTETKNIGLKYQTLYGGAKSIFKIIKLLHNNDLYVTDAFNLFYIKDENEGKALIELMKIRLSILRELEIKSWK